MPWCLKLSCGQLGQSKHRLNYIIWAKNVKLLKFAMVSDYSAAFIGITTQWEGGRVEPETGLRWRSFSGQWTATAQLSHNIIRDESPITNIYFSKVKPTKDRMVISVSHSCVSALVPVSRCGHWGSERDSHKSSVPVPVSVSVSQGTKERERLRHGE